MFYFDVELMLKDIKVVILYLDVLWIDYCLDY